MAMVMRTHLMCLVVSVGCHHNVDEVVDASTSSDAGTIVDAPIQASNLLGLSCAATSPATQPALCPPPSGAAGEASFCFRPQWPGVTSVDVLVDRGNAADWTTPFVTLADAGDGTFRATVPLADGSYPYLFKVQGSADGVIKNFQYALDQNNAAFVPDPTGSPIMRSASQLTVPQIASPIRHVHGTVVDNGVPQPCFVVMLDVGELTKPGGAALSEHYTANFVESASDGTFDFPVADGPAIVNVKYPFGLTTTYPDPMMTPSIGMARTSFPVAGADVTLDPTEIGYDHTSYTALSPTGNASLPVTFTWDTVAGASASAFAVISTNIAGNDPAYLSAYGTATSMAWNGAFGNGVQAVLGTTYYWGSWQKRAGATTTWTSESLLFPITFH